MMIVAWILVAINAALCAAVPNPFNFAMLAITVGAAIVTTSATMAR